jgi:hypothetical protein
LQSRDRLRRLQATRRLKPLVLKTICDIHLIKGNSMVPSL